MASESNCTTMIRLWWKKQVRKMEFLKILPQKEKKHAKVTKRVFFPLTFIY